MTLRVGNLNVKVAKMTTKNEAERLARAVHTYKSLYSKSEKTFKDINVTGLVTNPIFSFCLTICKPPTVTTATAKIQNENRQEIPFVDRSLHFCSKVLPHQLLVHEYILNCV